MEAALVRRLPSQLKRLAPSICSELIRLLPSLYTPSVSRVATALLQIEDFDRILRFCQRRGVWPEPNLAAPSMLPISAFADLDVPQLPTVDLLADWLLLPKARLQYLADEQGRHEEHGDTAVNHYHYVLKEKKTKGIRLLEAPKANLKAVQRQILSGIIDQVPTQPDVFGFVKQRNCLDGARRHANEELVVCFDLKDFFPSIGSGRIFGLFRCLGYPHAIARTLTALCTTSTPPRILERLNFEDRIRYRSPHLPQGSPVSPALANQVVFSLDRRLSALAKSLDANFSRYADDLCFSGDRHIVGALLNIVPQIVRDEGFRLNTQKTRIMSHSSRQVVTGIVVNEHLNISRASFDHLKAVIHACGKAGDLRLHDPRFRASLLGKIAWVEQVNANKGQKLRRLLETAWSHKA